jgi:hypothetical protein
MAVNNKSNNPFYFVDTVTYVETADKIVGLTGLATGPLEIKGSGVSPVLKLVAAEVNNNVYNDVNITLTNMTVKQDVFGGVIVSSKTDPTKPKLSKKYLPLVDGTLMGDATVTINSGTFRDVYGGGGGFNSTVTGDTTVNYYGGNVKNIFGGGSTGAIVEGNAVVNIVGSPAGGRIGKIYGGGNNATVTGSTTVTFSPDANLIKFTGTVDGGGKGKNAIVGGSRNLVFDNYSGNFNAKIKNFTDIQLIGSANVTLTKTFDKSLAGANYNFVLTDASLGNVNAMLTLTKKHDTINNVTVTIDSAEMVNTGGEVYLISSRFFRYDYSFNADEVVVLNASGQQVSSFAYTINYTFDRRLGGDVSIEYLGGNLVLDGTETEKVILGDADDEVNIVGGNLVAGIDTDGGDDIVNVQAGSTVNGGLVMGIGNDTLYIQADTEVNGYIDMDGGDDRVVINEYAVVTSDIILGDGVNTLDIQLQAMATGIVVLAPESVNYININGGGISNIDSGDESTTNYIVVNGNAVNGGGIGYWNTFWDYEYGYHTYTEFTARDLILGDSQDNVTINRYAQVNSIYLGGGDDVLTINCSVDITGCISLGAGDDTLILNASFSGPLIANEGNNVIVANTSMSLNGDFLNLASTNNVLVITNGSSVVLDGVSIGRFLDLSNDGVYLSQNATVTAHDTMFIQDYVGHMCVGGDECDSLNLYILAAPESVPTEIGPYYSAYSNGVESSEISVTGGLTVEEGANVSGSDLMVVGDSLISGNLDDVDLASASATVDSTGTVVDSVLGITGDLNVDGVVSSSDLLAGGTVAITGTVEDSTVEATAIDVDGVVTLSDLSATGINVNVGTLTGSLTATTNVNFTVDFANAALVVDAPQIGLLTEGILVTIGTTTATDFALVNDAMLALTLDDTLVVGPVTLDVDLGAMGFTNISLTGVVGADVAFADNIISFDGNVVNNEVFQGLVTLDGANTFVINVDSWFDWQQLIINPLATLGFDIADYTLMAVDGYVDVDPMTVIVDQTTLGQNSRLALGDTIYIGDWDNNFILPLNQNPFGPGNATNLVWSNVYIVEDAQIWGAVALDSSDNELVVSDGVEINGRTDLYDYAAILTLAGNDTVTVGAAAINGTIYTREGDDILTLTNSVVNTAINQGVPAIDMGSGDDETTITDSYVGGDIDMGSGADTLIIDPSVIDGDIDLGDSGEGTNIAAIFESTINGDITGGTGIDELLVADLSTVNGDIAMGAGDDLVDIIDSTINGEITTGDGDDAVGVLGSTLNGGIDTGAGNDLVVIVDSNATINGDINLGDGINEALIHNSVVNGDVIGGANTDVVELTGATLIDGDVVLGDGANEAVVTDSEITGNLLGGSGEDLVALDNAIIGAGIDLGSGGVNEIIAGDATVALDVVMGTQEVDVQGIPLVPFDTTADNLIEVASGSTLAVGGNLLMAGATNEVVAEGTLDVTEDVQMVAEGSNTNYVNLIAGGGTINVGGSMTMINNASSSGGNVIEFRENDLTPGGDSALVVTGPLSMVGESNEVYTPWYGLSDNDELVVGDVNTDLQASSLDMLGMGNYIGFGVAGDTDGSYDDGPTPDLHVISRLELGASTLTLDAPVSMDGMYNYVEIGMFLYADQEGDIFVNGPTTVTANGGISMEGADNMFYAGIDLYAGEQSLVEVNTPTQVTVNGDVDMLSWSTSSNYAYLGLVIDEFVAPDITTSDGEVIVDEATQTTLIDGSFTMAGTGTLNYLEIYSNVTVTGSIVMGEVIGDALSAQNVLYVYDPGTFSGSTIVLTAEANDVFLWGAGNVTGLTAIYGGSNYLEVGTADETDVHIDGVVSFGGVYDADLIGTEGYQIQANTDNTVYVYGTVGGIDTTVDLGLPLPNFVNDSIDKIYILGGQVIDTVEPGADGQIVTGNGLDTVKVIGGIVEGGISMGDTTLGDAYGKNMLYVQSTNVDDDPILSLPATVTGDVSMESDTYNLLNITGKVLTDPDTLKETEVRATIDGNVDMAALEHDVDGVLLPVGTNDLDIGVAATITGAVTMTSGGGVTNDVDVDADWLKEYNGGPNDGQIFDGTSDVLSLTMVGDVNELDVNTGTFIISEATGVLGLSMTQAQPNRDWSGGYNMVVVTDEAAMVMSLDPANVLAGRSDILMGNTVDTFVSGVYDYASAAMYGPDLDIELYTYDWSGSVAGAIFDTTENVIEVGGKLYTGDNTMIGELNVIDVVGPASTSVDVSGGVYDLTTSLYEGGLVTQSGIDNMILVGTGMPGPGEAAFVSGNILQTGIAVPMQVASDTNVIDVSSDAWFSSGSIDQFALTSNTIVISGYQTPVILGAFQDTITESLVDGPITQIADPGNNYASLYTTDVNGNISQDAGMNNELYIAGESLPYAIDDNGGTTDDYLAAPNTVVKSTVTGNINQIAEDGNAASLDMADVTGSVTQLTDIGGNAFESNGIFMVGGLPNGPAVYGQDLAGNDIWLQDAFVDENIIGGPLSQTATDSGNFALLELTDVNGDVTQTAQTGNTLVAIGELTNPTIGDNIDGSESVLQGKDDVPVDISGNVLMETATNDNGADLIIAKVGGSMTMNADTGSNGLFLAGEIAGPLAMNAEVNNDLLSIGGWAYASTGPDAGGNDIILPGAPDPTKVLEAQIGGVSMVSATGWNDAELYTTDVNGSIAMTALAGDNELDVVGDVIPDLVSGFGPNIGTVLEVGQTLTSTVTGTIDMIAQNLAGTAGGSNSAYLAIAASGAVNMDAYVDNDIKVTASTIGALTQTAITGSNTANIDPSTTGDVTQTAEINNTLDVTGEYTPVDPGDITQPGGPGTEEFLAPADLGAVESSTVGVVAMTATTGTNTATLTDGNSSAITMTAFAGNTLTATGTVIPELLGDDGLGDPAGKVLQADSVEASTITGDVTMVATDAVTGASNTLTMVAASVVGNVDMTAAVIGFNTVSVDEDSGITGTLTTGDGSIDDGNTDDVLDIAGTVGGDISTGGGDDDMDIAGTANLGGIIDMGANDDLLTMDLNFDLEDILSEGTLVIDGTGDLTLDNGATFGNANLTQVDFTGTGTLTFAGEDNTLDAGDVHSSATTTLFDITGLGNGDVLIDADLIDTSWDILDNAAQNDFSIEYTGGGLTDGQAVVLIDEYANMAADLSGWAATTITLDVGPGDIVTLNAGVTYSGVSGLTGDTWTLEANGDDLQLSFTAFVGP